MKITRRFAVASLLVIAVAMVLGAPPPASAGKVKGYQSTLYPTADSPSPNATGTVTLIPASTPPAIVGVVVSVSKLAPNASYYMPVTVLDPRRGTTYVWNIPIQTDAQGKGQSGWYGYNRGWYSDPYKQYHYDYYVMFSSAQVYDASGTLVLGG